jgi:hypothetical protein
MCLCSAQTSVNVLTIKDRERGRLGRSESVEIPPITSDCLEDIAQCENTGPSPIVLIVGRRSRSRSLIAAGSLALRIDIGTKDATECA